MPQHLIPTLNPNLKRYELFLDGKRIGRGSERGDVRNWFYETYVLKLSAGPHSSAYRLEFHGLDAGVEGDNERFAQLGHPT